MDYVRKLLQKISIKGLTIHLVSLVVAMSVVWGISYFLLVTFSIQDSNATISEIKPEPFVKANATSTATSTIKAKNLGSTTKATSTKSKK